MLGRNGWHGGWRARPWGRAWAWGRSVPPVRGFRSTRAPERPASPATGTISPGEGCKFVRRTEGQALEEQGWTFTGRKWSKNRYEVCPPREEVSAGTEDGTMSGLGEMSVREEYTRAFSAALVADLARNPSLALAVASGRTSPARLRDEALSESVRGVRTGRSRFPHVAALVRQQVEAEKSALREAGMGAEEAKAAGSVWDAVGAAIAGAAGIASSILGKKYEAKGNEAVAKLNAQSQQLSLQAQQLASQTAERMTSVSRREPGTPGWVAPVAIGGGVLLLGGIVYAATRKGRR